MTLDFKNVLKLLIEMNFLFKIKPVWYIIAREKIDHGIEDNLDFVGKFR